MVIEVTAGAVATFFALDPIKKLLGPTAEYYGAEFANWSKQRWGRAARIAEIAAEQTPEHDTSGASVSPRVLIAAMNEGSKVDDEIAMRYFGGVLASSRSDGGRDDSSIEFTSLLATMPTMQIKMHHALYSSLRARWLNTPASLASHADRQRLTTVVSYERLAKMVGPFVLNIETVMFGLYRVGLINNFRFGSFMKAPDRNDLEQYIQFEPTVLGCCLYIAAHGNDPRSAATIVSPGLITKDMIATPSEGFYAPEEVQKFD